ncbi:endonuclease III [Croceicoccus sp. Ery15]|uniref:endonuclease III n=1 Tax=Croceicoccus sp. Ery15 TaxID=1703338 RepID=UPI001E379432|nr:endonuclease III [Croceicoccus sp. Ery15]
MPERRGHAPKNKAEVFEFFRLLAEDNPDPQTELEFGNTYQLVVAVALSAQATDVGVNKATRRLFEQVKTPQQMLDLGEDGLKEHIKTIGLFNSKAKNVIAAAQMLVEEYGGEVPRDRDALVRLPGVGRKTANVVLNCAFGEAVFPVDTHVFRVGNRTGIARGKTPEKVEAQLEKKVPEPFRVGAHHWLILHGRYLCKARTPECWRCPVVDLCGFRVKVLEKPKGR